ncbi:MAG: hypothetical protein ACE5E7_03870 [Anaerolineae bacterium]
MYQFIVMRYPPKKDQATSSWSERNERESGKVAALRKAAIEAGVKRINGQVKLTLEIHIPNDQNAGDLANYIGGICDGLQTQPKNTVPHPAIPNPDIAIAYEDDKYVTEIDAKIIYSSNNAWYQVSIEPLEGIIYD